MKKDTKPVKVSREEPAKKNAKAARTNGGTSLVIDDDTDDDELSEEELALIREVTRACEFQNAQEEEAPAPAPSPAPVPEESPEPVSDHPRKPGRKPAKKPARKPASEGDCTFVVHMTPAVRNLAKTYAAMAGLSLNQYIVDLIVDDARKGTARLQKMVNNL